MSYADKPWLKSYKSGPFPLKKSMQPYPKHNLYKFLEDSAAKYPDVTACVYLDTEITYTELKLQVDKLATALAALGVKKGDRVATVLPNCPQFIISDFAILSIGAVHVPISILHKFDDLVYEIGESGAGTVICSYKRLELVKSVMEKVEIKTVIYTPVPILPDYKMPKMEEVPWAQQLEDLIEKHDANPPTVEINPEEDLALVPFTGGTTGLPKGTMITHYNVTTNVIQAMHWMMAPLLLGLKGKASLLLCIPMFHQFGHIAQYTAISLGLRIFLVDPRDIPKIVAITKKHRPFIVLGVPTHFMMMLPHDLPRMQIFMLSGAAALPPEVAEGIEKKIGVPMGEGYGLTEATAATHLNLSAFSKVTGFAAKVKRSIGVPIPDTEVRIVNLETGEDAPFSETGELWIRGPQIMKGYWPTPGKGLEDGWLKTGDIAKMDPDGYFHIVDRIKDMINVSGMKVYSRVIDDALYEHPAVSVVGVIGVPDPDRPGSERVKAFIQLKKEFEGKVTEEDIIKFCKEKLPPYAVPKSVEFRKTLPVTLAMKIHKKKLREEEIAKTKK